MAEVVPSTNAVQQLDDADDLQFTLPDASLFDDSLDEDFCSKALDHAFREADDVAEREDKADLDDSLRWEDGAEQAPNDTNPSCHGSKVHLSADEPSTAQNVSEPPFKVGLSLHSKFSSEYELEVDPECLSVAVDDELFPENLHADKKTSGKELPDTESPMVSAEQSDPGNSGALKSESPAEKVIPGSQSASKVVPSFGKKKKGFAPPAPAAKAAHAKTAERVIENDATATQPEVTSPVQEHEVCDREQDSPADKDKENSPTTEQNFNRLQAEKTTSQKCNLKIEKSSPGGKPANGKRKTSEKPSKNKQELEEKRKERERKRQAQEQKKQERELKKAEKEQKKAERDRLKEEKRLAQEQKNAEREQKKMEAELKKIEREQKKASQKSQNKTKPSGNASTSDSEPARPLTQEVGKCTKDCPDVSPVGAEPLQTDNITEGHESTMFAETDASVSISKATVSVGAKNACEDDSRETSPDVSTSHADALSEEQSVDKPSLASLPDQHTPSSCAHTSESTAAVEPLPPELHQTLPPPASDESAVTDLLKSTPQSSSAAEIDSLRDDRHLQRSVEGDCKNASNSESKPSDVSVQSPVSGVEECGDTSNSSHTIIEKASRQDSGKPWKPPLVAAASSKAGKNSETKARKQQQTSKKSVPTLARKSDETSATALKESKLKSQLKERKTSSVTPAKMKRKAAKTISRSSDGEGECDSALEEPKRKRSKPMNYSGPVWVQCGRPSCGKWRQLAGCLDPSDVPETWECSMNTDTSCSSCSAPEQQWSDSELGGSQEFVESPFIPGSVVWARMDGYPWWPAMVEEDPDKEAYYEFGKGKSNVPVRYHVVFFDTPVCRGWVSSAHILALTEGRGANEVWNVHVAQKYKRGLKEGWKQAASALNMSTAKRLAQFGFAKRFQKSASRKRKSFFNEDDVSSHAPRAGRPIPGTRKSMRVGGNLSHTSTDSSREESKREERDQEDSESDEHQHLPGAVAISSSRELHHSGKECDLNAAAEKDMPSSHIECTH